MNAAELRGVSYVYSEHTPFCKVAVDNIDITFEEKLVTGIIGHTGSGKSTVSQLLNGLLKPSSGVVEVDGKDIWAEPKKIEKSHCFFAEKKSFLFFYRILYYDTKKCEHF